MVQKRGKFGEANGALADFEMFILVAVVIMQMNVLQAWPKRLDTGLNTAIHMGMAGIQRTHHGGMSDAVDKSQMIAKGGNDLSGAQLYVFNADPYTASGGHGGTLSKGIKRKLGIDCLLSPAYYPLTPRIVNWKVLQRTAGRCYENREIPRAKRRRRAMV